MQSKNQNQPSFKSTLHKKSQQLCGRILEHRKGSGIWVWPMCVWVRWVVVCSVVRGVGEGVTEFEMSESVGSVFFCWYS